MKEPNTLWSIDRKGIEAMERIRRLNFINSVAGFKSANLIGTASPEGQPNLAIVSSVIHLSSSPAVIGFIQRPTVVPRHTYQNIRSTGWYSINQVHQEITDRAHYTSAKFDAHISEFEQAGLTEQYVDGYPAPFVLESRLRMMVRYIEEYHLKASNTIMMVGGIELVQIDEKAITSSGAVDLNAIGSVCISGLDRYHTASQIASYSYARPGAFPVNTMSER
jgi:flavin reductase (DIM6/NTAB) family NADH-FMN oxidoreductase RutF